jgi:hypothetical protein
VFPIPCGDETTTLAHVNLTASRASDSIYPTVVKRGKVGSAKVTKDGVGRSECYL